MIRAIPVLSAIALTLLLLSSCQKQNEADPVPTFGPPKRVDIAGYSGNSMEPFLSRDGATLFFNNLNSAPENTNLHWSSKINDSTFQYLGELSGINTTALEAVATMDNNGVLYFVSDRNYASTLSTIYSSTFSNGSVSAVALVNGVSKNQAGWVNFDTEVDPSGEEMYFADGRYDQAGGPHDADLVIARKSSNGFERLSNSHEILKNINTNALEYAACISADGLEFYFTRTEINSFPEIFRAHRKTKQDAFGVATRIESITGFVEAPTISPDGKIIYYHKSENGKFVIYLVRKIA